MITDWLVGTVQASAVMAVTLLWTLNRIDRWATATAKMCGLSLIIGAVLFTTCFLPMPRLFVLRSEFFPSNVRPDQTAASERENTRSNDLHFMQVDRELEAEGHLGLSLSQLSSWISQQFSAPESDTSIIRMLKYSLIAAFLFAFARFAMGCSTAWKLSRTSVVLPRFQWPTPASQLLNNFPELSELTIRVHLAVTSPCVHFLSRKTIYVPPSFLTWTDQEIESAMIHEMSHLKRGDAWWRVCGEFMLVPLAFNPLAYSLRRRLVVAQEFATDQMAAAMIDDAQRYRKGLARLCLRLSGGSEKKSKGSNLLSINHSNRFCIGVIGVSNDLVRRIKMLERQDVSSAQRNYASGRAAIVGLLMIAVVVGSWSLQADEPPRVAARPDSTSESAGGKLFTRDNLSTTDGLGTGLGLVEIRPSLLATHPMVGNVLQTINQIPICSIDGQPKSASDFGLDVTRVETVQASPKLTLSYKAGDERPTSLALGASAFYVRSANDVDWPSLIRSINSEPFGPSVNKELLTTIAAQQAVSRELKITPKISSESSMTPPVSLAKIWKHVDGGVISMVTSAPQVPDTGEDQLDSHYKLVFNFVEKIEAIGIGVDLEPSSPNLYVRLVLTAVDEVDESQLASEFKGLTRSLAELLETDPSRSLAETKLMKSLSSAEVAVIREQDLNATISVEFELDPAVLPQ